MIWIQDFEVRDISWTVAESSLTNNKNITWENMSARKQGILHKGTIELGEGQQLGVAVSMILQQWTRPAWPGSKVSQCFQPSWCYYCCCCFSWLPSHMTWADLHLAPWLLLDHVVGHPGKTVQQQRTGWKLHGSVPMALIACRLDPARCCWPLV